MSSCRGVIARRLCGSKLGVANDVAGVESRERLVAGGVALGDDDFTWI